MSVADILGSKGHSVVTATPDMTLAEVATRLAEHKIGALVVVDGEKVCGIASERDLIRYITSHGADALSQPISECMTKDVVSCERHDSIDKLMELMTDGRFRHLPVVEDAKLVGIISIGDVVKRKIEQAERDTEELKRYIAG